MTGNPGLTGKPGSERWAFPVDIVVVVLIVVVALVVLFTVPISHQYSDALASGSSSQLAAAQLTVPTGPQVTVTWQTSSGSDATVDFLNGPAVSQSAIISPVTLPAPSGSFTFTANSGNYYIFIITPYTGIEYTVTYSTPIL